MGHKAGANLFEYVWDSPTKWTDPSGKQYFPWVTSPPPPERVMPWNPNAQWWFGLPNLFASIPQLDGDPAYCGIADVRCHSGQTLPAPVYGNSQRAMDLLALDDATGGCVTFPDGIHCTMDCDKIKTQESGDNRSRLILQHEGCHYCLLKEQGFTAYIGSAGRAPDYCVGREVPVRPNW